MGQFDYVSGRRFGRCASKDLVDATTGVIKDREPPTEEPRTPRRSDISSTSMANRTTFAQTEFFACRNAYPVAAPVAKLARAPIAVIESSENSH